MIISAFYVKKKKNNTIGVWWCNKILPLERKSSTLYVDDNKAIFNSFFNDYVVYIFHYCFLYKKYHECMMVLLKKAASLKINVLM